MSWRMSCLKYKAKYDKFEKLSDDELLHNLLTERGIGDVEGFINLNENCLCDAKEFENIAKRQVEEGFRRANNAAYAKGVRWK